MKNLKTTARVLAFALMSLSFFNAPVQAASTAVGIASSANFLNLESVATAYFPLQPESGIQAYFGIGGTSPFHFGTGGIFKYTVSGNDTLGLHVGGGLGLGTVPNSGTTAKAGSTSSTFFFFTLLGNAGVHFRFQGLNRLVLALDAGPGLQIVDGDANFAIEGYSPILGLSAVYEL